MFADDWIVVGRHLVQTRPAFEQLATPSNAGIRLDEGLKEFVLPTAQVVTHEVLAWWFISSLVRATMMRSGSPGMVGSS